MSKPTIIGSVRSTFTRVVRMVCEEKGVDYELIETTLGAEALFAIHPFGKMPVLRHGDVTLCESKAIATYLDRAFPGPQLIPSDPYLAGFTEQSISLVNSPIDPLLVRSYLLADAAPKTPDGKPDRGLIDQVAPKVAHHIAILDEAVAKTGYLVDGQFTLADITLLPILFYMQQLPESRTALASAANLSSYYDQHAVRPSFASTVPPLGPPSRSGSI